MPPTLLDTDTLSEIMKGQDFHIQQKAQQYLGVYGYFTFSIITRYEILRGLKAKEAIRQLSAFERRCQKSNVLPLTDEVIIQAADIYGNLYRQGQLISDADILIGATALVHGLALVTKNIDHFQRISHLGLENWCAS